MRCPARSKRVPFAAFLCVVLMSVAAGAETEGDIADDSAPLTTEVAPDPWVPINPLWHVFALPEYLTEAAFIPLAFVVSATERYRLDRRMHDLLVSDDGNAMLVPNIKLSGSDGVGLGGTLVLLRVFGSDDRFAGGGTHRFNGDVELGALYRHSVAGWEGREFELRFNHVLDRNSPWYGRGNNTDGDHRRVLKQRYLVGKASLDLLAPGSNVQGRLTVNVRQQTISYGESKSYPSVDPADPEVKPPAQFDETLRYPRLAVSLTYDSRDSVGRPTVGIVGETGTSVTKDVSGGHTSAVAGYMEAWTFLNILPRHRVIALGAGGAFSLPLERGDAVPFHEFVVLGRDSHLRGYDKQRFRDRMGWWASAEYRFPIWEYMTSSIEASPVLFFDVGRVAHEREQLVRGRVRWSTGIGLRGASDTLELFSLSLGLSPEGIAFLFDIGGIL